MSKKIREITLDFTGVKTLWELHERIRVAFVPGMVREELVCLLGSAQRAARRNNGYGAWPQDAAWGIAAVWEKGD